MKYTLSIILILILLSCKKKNKTTNNSTPNTTVPTQTVTLYNGFFPLEKYEQWVDGVTDGSASYNCKMQLYSNAVADYSIWQASNLGNITVNGNELKYNSIIKIYIDTTVNPNYSASRIISLNSVTLPTFTTNVGISFPSYNSINASQINDTIFLNSNFNVSLNGINNYDLVSAQVTTIPDVTTGPIVAKNNISPTNQIVFSPNDLSVFQAGQQLYLRLVLKKYTTQTSNNKNYRIECLSYNDFYLLAQ